METFEQEAWVHPVGHTLLAAVDTVAADTQVDRRTAAAACHIAAGPDILEPGNLGQRSRLDKLAVGNLLVVDHIGRRVAVHL